MSRPSSTIAAKVLALGAAMLATSFVAACTLAIGADELDEGCPSGTKACAGACVRLTDPEYACALPICSPCALGNATSACGPTGTCVIAGCKVGYADCNGSSDDGCEVATSADPAHCGGCGLACPTPPQGEEDCASGLCVIRKCDEGFDDCNHAFADGCEVDLTSDDANCGECGFLCGDGTSCAMGACR